MAKTEKAPNVNSDHGIVGLEYSADKFKNADGSRVEDAKGNKLHGVQHWYALNEQGKKVHISETAMLDKFGYDSDDFQGPKPTGESTEPVDTIIDGIVEPVSSPIPGKIGCVKLTVGRPSVPAEHLVDRDKPTDTSEVDDDREEKAKEALIAKLYEDMDFMTNSAVAFEKTGKMEDRDKAFIRFAEMFDTLAELQGWDKEKRDEYMANWINIVKSMLKDDKDKDNEDEKTDEDDEETKKAQEAIERSAVLTELSGRLKISRDRLAKLNVQASGRIRQGGKLKAELADARAEWQALQVEVGAKTMEHVMLLEDGVTEEKMRGFAAQGAKNEANELSAAQLAAIEAGPEGGRIKKFMHKYARTYNEAGRIKKMFLLAPGGVIVGLGIGTIFGAIGGGIAAGLVARGAVKGALTSKMQALKAKEGSQIDTGSFNISLKDEDAARVPQLLALRAAGLNRFSTETEVSQNSRQNKKRAGIAISIGAAAGIASGMLANHLTDQSLARGSGLVGKKIGWDPFDGQRPSGGGNVIGNTMPNPPSLAPGAAELESLSRLLNADGEYPWSRAMDFFNGDNTQANNWLQEAVRRTPGAEWHNLGDGVGENDWISINGNSNTGYVWEQLTKSMLTPPKS